MTFSTFCLCHQARVRERSTWLSQVLQRRRIAKERRARFFRLWREVEDRCS